MRGLPKFTARDMYSLARNNFVSYVLFQGGPSGLPSCRMTGFPRKGGEAMVYLINPHDALKGKPCKTNCNPFFCAVKPLYGIGP
jgi:hypothetical protein